MLRISHVIRVLLAFCICCTAQARQLTIVNNLHDKNSVVSMDVIQTVEVYSSNHIEPVTSSSTVTRAVAVLTYDIPFYPPLNGTITLTGLPYGKGTIAIAPGDDSIKIHFEDTKITYPRDKVTIIWSTTSPVFPAS
jgi:hypothetical protein